MHQKNRTKERDNASHSDLRLPSFLYKDIFLNTLLCVSALVYGMGLWLSRSISFDDWDTVQFALAIDKFDMSLHQPHPPGYPIYVGILKFGSLFTSDYLDLMIFVSIVSAFITLFAWFVIVKEFKDTKYAITFTILLALFPLFTVNSLKGLTDMPALALYSLSILMFVKYIKVDDRSQLVYSIATGATFALLIGLRIQLIVAILIPMLWIGYREYKRNGSKVYNYSKYFYTGVATFVVTNLAWLIPSILVSGGIQRYTDLLRGQYVWRYEIDSHTPFQYGFDPMYFLTHGLEHVHSLLRGGFGLIDSTASFNETTMSLQIFTIVICLSLIAAVLVAGFKYRKSLLVQLFFYSAVPYMIFMYLNLNWENARYWLPLVPWLLIGFLLLLDKINIYLKAGFYFFALLVFSFNSSSMLTTISTDLTPPQQALAYIDDRYESRENVNYLYCEHNNQRHFQYLTEDEITFFEDEQVLLDTADPNKPILSCQCYKIGDGSALEVIESFDFYRDVRVHWKHSYLEMCEVGLK